MMPFSRYALALAGAAGFAGLIGGCATSRTEPAVVQAPLATRAPRVQTWPMRPAASAKWIAEQYTDLPIPKGFKFEPDKSFVFTQGSLRRADLNYEGVMTSRDVIRFYQDSMPTSGWQFLRLTGVRMKTLTFVKGNEMVEIIVEWHAPRAEHDAGQERMTRLHIKLNPS